MSNRIVVKEGFLKKVPQKKGASIFKKAEPRWFIFSLLNKQPFLEYFDTEVASQCEPPINSFLLRGTFTVTPCLGEYNDCAFLITTAERILKLIAPNVGDAREWMQSLNRTLREFANREMPENDYGAFEDFGAGAAASPKHNTERKEVESKNGAGLSPLENDYGFEPGLEELREEEDMVDEIELEKATAWTRGAPQHEEPIYGSTFGDDPAPSRGPRQFRSKDNSRQLSFKQGHSDKVFTDFTRLESKLQTAGHNEAAEQIRAQRMTSGHLCVDELGDDIYEHLEDKMRSLEDWEGLSDLRARRNQSAASVYKPNPTPPTFDPTQRPIQVTGFFERKNVGDANSNAEFSIVRQNSVNTTATGAPIPGTGTALYINAGPQLGLSPVLGAVETTKKQILHPGGVLITARPQDLLSSVAFVELRKLPDAGGSASWNTNSEPVWIAGWNTRATRLHNCFKIGDQVVGVNEFYPVDGILSVRKLIEATPPDQKTRVRLRRTPHAKVFAIQRQNEGQDLGMRRDGGTAEIVFVEPKGLAAKHGLTAKAVTVSDGGRQLCNWTLTEVNNRAVNLFYNKNEIEIRLNAFGKDISLVVQPTDFVQELRKSLKGIRNYKDYIVE